MPERLQEGKYYGHDVKSRENEHFKFSLTSYEPNGIAANHYHENSYLSILVQGRYLESNKREKIEIEPGNILFRPKGYDHSNAFRADGGRCFNIEFKKDWEYAMDPLRTLPASLQLYRTGSHPSLYKLLYGFFQDGHDDAGFELICDWLIQINGDLSWGDRLPWIPKVKAILENELDRFHTIQTLSERVFVHPIYLSGAFKKQTGMTVGEYQLQVKLENTVGLLLKTALSIKDIAYRSGFFDNAHFCRSFKSRYRVSPGKFRQMIKS